MKPTNRPPLARAMTYGLALSVLVVIGAIALFATSSSVDAQSATLSARIASWESADGTVELCLDLRDAVAGETRQCPRQRRLTFAQAPEGRWLRSRSIRIAPEVVVWIRARRVEQQLDLGLGVSIEGEARAVRGRSWSLNWETTPIDRWLRTTAIRLDLPVAPYPELWTTEAGIAAGAQRLQIGRRAPEFRLPRLGGPEDSLVSLSAARSGDPKSTLLVFWSSWSPFSDQTLTTLANLQANRDDLRVIGINVYEEAEDQGATFARRYGSLLDHLVDESGSVAQHYRVDGLPELFLIDAQGVYRAVIWGAAPLTEIVAALDALDDVDTLDANE